MVLIRLGEIQLNGRAALAPMVDDLLADAETSGRLDFIVQKALFAVRYGGVRPELTERELELEDMVNPELCDLLAEQGISATVLDMYCVKPLDAEAVIEAAGATRAVVTVEEHSPFGGLGSMVAQVVGEHCPRPVKCLSLPDAPVITGTSPEVFAHYGLTGTGIAEAVKDFLPAE